MTKDIYPEIEMNMKFPYGLCDFNALISEGYYYADRSDRISLLEDMGRHLLFLRPRRFGKSLLLSMLDNYYDIAKAGEFSRLFGHLKIAANPTAQHNNYFIMRWDFSMVKSNGSLQEIEAALHNHLNACIRYFAIRYRELLESSIPLQEQDGIASFHHAVSAIQTTPYKLYLLIDEYDNFANEVMTASSDDYAGLVHGEGILKTVFKAVKALSAGQGIERVFITGVSPVAMSDISSAYNVAENLSLDERFSDLCGFIEVEVAALLVRIGEECRFESSRILEALEMMRTFYNGYRFGYESRELIYNPTLALYFLKTLNITCRYPREMLDSNLAMDRNRIQYVGSLPHGQEFIGKVLNPDDPPVISQLSNRFGVEDILSATKDQPFMASLLYYLGVLTIGNPDFMGRITLRIPNLVTRRLYVERIQETCLPTYENKENRRKVVENFYHTGDLAPVCEFIEKSYFPIFDNRDYRWSNELVIKTAFLVILFSDIFYIMDSEPAIAHRYGDLSLIIRPDMRKYAILDHLLEFKYLSLKELGMSGEQLRVLDRATMAQLPAVRIKLQEAEMQLAENRQVLVKIYGDKLRLHTHAVVALGLERLVWTSR